LWLNKLVVFQLEFAPCQSQQHLFPVLGSRAVKSGFAPFTFLKSFSILALVRRIRELDVSADNRKPKEKQSGAGSTRRAFLKGLLAGSLWTAAPARSRALSGRRSGVYDFRGVRDAVVAAVGSHKATGVAVAVAHRGRIIWEEGFGWANYGAGIRVTEHTPFCLASITKPFTTTTMMTLVAAGKISLDDSANKYLGDSSLKGNAKDATIRLLGAHAGGLPSMFEMFPSAADTRQPSPRTLLENYGTLAYLPNEVYEYSNIGFVALGAIASNVTGLEFDEILTRQVLGPLGLHDSFFDTDKTRLAKGAVLYDELERPIPEYSTATPPSGGLYVSAHDLARFAMFNLKASLRDEAPIISNRLLDELHRPVFRGPSPAATTFGWFSGKTKSGLPVIFKSGGQPGVSTIIYMVPEENLACVALANRSDNGEFVQTLVDQMAGTIIPNWTTPNTSVDLPMVDFPRDSVYNGRWSGTLHGGGKEIAASLEITPSGGTLSLGDKGPETITNLRLQGSALVGKSIGKIESADAMRDHATSLSLKLQLRDNKLAGRILATATGAGELAVLPYVIELRPSN
jgi:CubicO group peptidase (beta-lactamase class C family)